MNDDVSPIKEPVVFRGGYFFFDCCRIFSARCVRMEKPGVIVTLITCPLLEAWRVESFLVGWAIWVEIW